MSVRFSLRDGLFGGDGFRFLSGHFRKDILPVARGFLRLRGTFRPLAFRDL